MAQAPDVQGLLTRSDQGLFDPAQLHPRHPPPSTGDLA